MLFNVLFLLTFFFLVGKMCDFYRPGTGLCYFLPKCQENSEFSMRGTKTIHLVETAHSFCASPGYGSQDLYSDFFLFLGPVLLLMFLK